ncbi:MAG TPA: Clp protease N-terminal domain-containing protein [Bryobacteraceae bacterium]
MFERYTEKARRSIFFARYEASQFGSAEIDTEHLLLGLFREDHSLLGLGPELPVEAIRKRIASARPGREKIPTSVDLPLSAACKRALAHGAEEAQKFGDEYIRTAHLLLGLLDQECFAAQMLHEFGWAVDTLRQAVAASPKPADSPRRPFAGWPTYQSWGALFSHPEAMRLYSEATAAARKLGSPVVETKHLLLVLVDRAGETFFGASSAAIREQIKPEPPRREKASLWIMPPSGECLRAISYAVEEAGRIDVGVEHLALGLLREESCEAAEILRAQGLSLDQVRRVVVEMDAAAPSGPGDNPGEPQGRKYV